MLPGAGHVGELEVDHPHAELARPSRARPPRSGRSCRRTSRSSGAHRRRRGHGLRSAAVSRTWAGRFLLAGWGELRRLAAAPSWTHARLSRRGAERNRSAKPAEGHHRLAKSARGIFRQPAKRRAGGRRRSAAARLRGSPGTRRRASTRPVLGFTCVSGGALRRCRRANCPCTGAPRGQLRPCALPARPAATV